MPRIPQVRRILFNDEAIGMGFNSESGLAVGTALEGFTIETNPAATGQEVTASITIVNSHEEMQDTLGMSFEAQGRYGFFSAAAKARFSETTNYNSTSTFLVASVLVKNPLRRGGAFAVSQTARDLLAANRFDEFKAAFGDSFVRGLQTGGEFYAVVRITSVSTSTQSELATALQAEANGLFAAGSFKAAFATANASASTRSEFTATMYQKAGAGAQISPTVEIAEVIARFKAFPEIAGASAAAYETEVATYDTLPLPVPTPQEQEAFLLALADARDKKLRFIQIRNDLEFAQANAAFFQALPDPATLTAAIAGYTRLINAVMAHAIELSRGQMNPPRLFDASALTPPLAEPAPIALLRAPEAEADLLEVQDLVGGLWDEIDEIRHAQPSSQADAAAISAGALAAGGGLFLTGDSLQFWTDARIRFVLRANIGAANPDAFLTQGRFEIDAQFPSSGTISVDELVLCRVRPLL